MSQKADVQITQRCGGHQSQTRIFKAVTSEINTTTIMHSKYQRHIRVGFNNKQHCLKKNNEMYFGDSSASQQMSR
jgi:hypothetical protein